MEPVEVSAPLVAAVVAALLDARPTAALGRFDERLAAAAAAGRVDAELAAELRFWQRSSVLEVIDHMRSVLPAVLPVAIDATAESDRQATGAAASAAGAWQHRTDNPAAQLPADAELTDAQPTDAEPTDAEPTDAEPTDAEPAEPATTAAVPWAGNTQPPPPPATEPPAAGQDAASVSNPHARRRLFVAGLTGTA
jgi:hypothetical protein